MTQKECLQRRLKWSDFSVRKILAVRKVLTAAVLSAMVATAVTSAPAVAGHSTYNPMVPRQLSEKAALADYTYGYSLLSGSALDSLETPNRYMWYLNYDLLDRYILRPVAHGYAALPQGFQNSVGHFLSNLDEVNNIPNNLLLGDVADSGVSLGRLVINSTIGLLGFFDVAAQLGLAARPMPMEVVLGKAGMEQGPFLMVPVYGPTTARDIHGTMIDGLPYFAVSWPITIAHWAVRGVHGRAQLVDQEGFIDNAVDPYIQTRDVFLMYDENQINPTAEGEVSAEDDFDESLLDEIDG